MKLKALLFTCVVAATAFAVQDSVQFGRSYKVGDKDKYTFKVNASLPMGAVDMNMTMSQEVVKTYDNGDADIKTTVSDMKLIMNGSEMPMPGSGPGGQSTTARISKLGVPVNKAAGQRMPGGMDQLLGMASMMGDKPMKIGEKVPINVTDPKDPKSKVVGTSILESVTGGIAKVNADVQIYNAQTGDKPIKVKTTSWIEVGTSKPNKVEGTVTDLPQQGGMAPDKVTFVMERAKA